MCLQRSPEWLCDAVMRLRVGEKKYQPEPDCLSKDSVGADLGSAKKRHEKPPSTRNDANEDRNCLLHTVFQQPASVLSHKYLQILYDTFRG